MLPLLLWTRCDRGRHTHRDVFAARQMSMDRGRVRLAPPAPTGAQPRMHRFDVSVDHGNSPGAKNVLKSAAVLALFSQAKGRPVVGSVCDGSILKIRCIDRTNEL